MGQQDGIMKIKGRVGDYSFYQTRDGFKVRKKSGVSGDRIRNGPEFAATREVSADFQKAVQASKILRTVFRPLLTLSGNKIARRMTKEMFRILYTDPVNERGRLDILEADLSLLKGFEFNLSTKLKSILFADFSHAADRLAGTLEVTVEPFLPHKMIVRPENATHFKLISAVAAIDFRGDGSALVTEASPEIPLSKEPTGPIVLRHQLSAEDKRPWVQIFGIAFYKLFNGKYYDSGNDSLSIVYADKGA